MLPLDIRPVKRFHEHRDTHWVADERWLWAYRVSWSQVAQACSTGMPSSVTVESCVRQGAQSAKQEVASLREILVLKGQ